MEWHVWDFPDNIRVYFKDEFREWLFKRLKEICGSRTEIGRKLKVSTTTIRSYFQTGHDSDNLRTYVPVRIIKKIIKLFSSNFDGNFLQELEKNIIAYRCRAGWPVYDPILPIKESPKLYSIVCHMVGDGSAGKGKTPYYANTCAELRREFIKNLQIFGKVEVNVYLAKTGVTYIMFPKAITDVLSHIFNVRFTYPNTLPLRLFITTDDCKRASIRAMFDDEGTVSTVFAIDQRSKRIIVQLKNLLEILKIKTGEVIEAKNGMYSIVVYSESFQEYKNSIGFTHIKKQRKLNKKVTEKKYRSLYKPLKIRIYELLLSSHPLTRIEVADNLNSKYPMTKLQLYRLKNEGKVFSKFNGKNQYYLWYPTNSNVLFHNK